MLLEIKLEEGNADEALALHSAARHASWFPEYLSLTSPMAKLVELAFGRNGLTPHVIPLILSFLRLVDSQERLEVILEVLSETLSEGNFYTDRDDIELLSTTFEQMLQFPPQWLLSSVESGGDLCSKAVERMNFVVSALRAEENGVRALLRWNERTFAFVRHQQESVRDAKEGDQSEEAIFVEYPMKQQTFGSRVRGFLVGALGKSWGGNPGTYPSGSEWSEDSRKSEYDVSTENSNHKKEIHYCSAAWDL